VFWIDLPEQWDAKSPWHDRRVRLAASLALDRQAVNQAESLGTSRSPGSIVPRSFEFALPFDPPAYDPGKAKQLLAEAGYAKRLRCRRLLPVPTAVRDGRGAEQLSRRRRHPHTHPHDERAAFSDRVA